MVPGEQRAQREVEVAAHVCVGHDRDICGAVDMHVKGGSRFRAAFWFCPPPPERIVKAEANRDKKRVRKAVYWILDLPA